MSQAQQVLRVAAEKRRDDLATAREQIKQRLEQIKQAKAAEVDLHKSLAKVEEELEILVEALNTDEE